jgi:hypothetical protein
MNLNMDRLKNKILSKIEHLGECWNYTGSPNSKYPAIQFKLITKSAHKWSYEIWNGPVPDKFHVHHKCENKRCVNPDHLEAISAKKHRKEKHEKLFVASIKAMNKASAASKRAITHCPQGHKYDKENTYWHNNKRYCKKCVRVNKKKYRERIKNG